MKKPYAIGLDIGTSSVGYAIVTEDYKVPSKKIKVLGNTDKTRITKNLLGASLFNKGKTAEETRMKRAARRRYSRRKNRLRYLQDIFTPEMLKVDEAFFHRLEESFLVEEDKTYESYPIFANEEDEKSYHQEFPTIYHLREQLANSHEQADLRLIYLAIAHIMKFRGHFLYESAEFDLNNTDLEGVFSAFLELYNQKFGTELIYNPQVSDILTDSISRTGKVERVLALYPSEKKSALAQYLKLLVGNKADFKKVLELDEEAPLQITSDTFEDDLAALVDRIDEEFGDLCQASKSIYDAVILSSILTVSGSEAQAAPLSASMIQRYEEHKADLTALKVFIKQNFSHETFIEVFREQSKHGYAGYIVDAKRTPQEKFYKYMTSLLKGKEGAEVFLDKIERENFLRKQRTFDNGFIPHQVHLQELRAILSHQGHFYPFLKENQEKIETIFTFRIPYYVGPLAKDNSRFAWMDRKTNEPVRPWNFEEVVDKDKAAIDFIERMTLNDLYLPDQKVLPRHSMIYELYTVLNELTKVKFVTENGIEDYFDFDHKKEIVNGLFKMKRKVSKKDLLAFLNTVNIGFRISDIKGVDKAFNANLATYNDFVKMGISKELLDNPENEAMFEDISLALTIFEDRDILKKRLDKYKGILGESVIKSLSRKHYTGWGRLSAKLLNGIRHKASNKTILDYLWDDPAGNRNLMQLINDESLDFRDTIEKNQTGDDTTDLVSLVEGLPGSPAIKKGIRQTIKVVDELIGIMGYEPSHIFIEMARDNMTTSKGKDLSKERLERIKAGFKELDQQTVDLPKDNKELNNVKRYLYYLQNGKDMYTGQDLDLSRLSDYDVDHIIPRSFKKDNSIDNLVLTSSEKNRGKSDDVPSQDIVKRMKPFWGQLKKSGLLSERKYMNLTKGERGGLTEEDKAGFIHRQLVETRQITKHIARLLSSRYNGTNTDKKVKVVTMKANLVSHFRKNFELYKVRDINDYHHAHDAYLNAVVGQSLLKVYPKIERDLVYGQFKRVNYTYKDKATQEKYFYQNIMKFFYKTDKVVDPETGEIVWDSSTALPVIKKVLSYRQVNIAKKTEVQTGEFFNALPVTKSESNKLIPLKKGQSTSKYGGYSSPNTSYVIFVRGDKNIDGKVKHVKELVGINIFESRDFEKNSADFLIQKKGFESIIKISVIKVPIYSLFEFEGGIRWRLVSVHRHFEDSPWKGKGEIHRANQIVLEQKFVTLLYHCQKLDQSLSSVHFKYLENHRSEFSELFEVLITYAEKFIQKSKVVKKLKDEWNNKKENVDIKLLSKSFIELLVFTQAGEFSNNLQFIDAVVTPGNMRYQSVKKCTDSTLIHQSVTGLYETRIDLGKL